jgi:hypothetical protein
VLTEVGFLVGHYEYIYPTVTNVSFNFTAAEPLAMATLFSSRVLLLIESIQPVCNPHLSSRFQYETDNTISKSKHEVDLNCFITTKPVE